MNFILVVVIVGCVGLNNSTCRISPYSINFTFDNQADCERAAANMKVPSNYGIYIEKACVAEKQFKND